MSPTFTNESYISQKSSVDATLAQRLEAVREPHSCWPKRCPGKCNFSQHHSYLNAKGTRNIWCARLPQGIAHQIFVRTRQLVRSITTFCTARDQSLKDIRMLTRDVAQQSRPLGLVVSIRQGNPTFLPQAPLPVEVLNMGPTHVWFLQLLSTR